MEIWYKDFYIFFTPLPEIFTLFLREYEVEFIYAEGVTLNIKQR